MLSTAIDGHGLPCASGLMMLRPSLFFLIIFLNIYFNILCSILLRGYTLLILHFSCWVGESSFGWESILICSTLQIKQSYSVYSECIRLSLCALVDDKRNVLVELFMTLWLVGSPTFCVGVIALNVEMQLCLYVCSRHTKIAILQLQFKFFSCFGPSGVTRSTNIMAQFSLFSKLILH